MREKPQSHEDQDANAHMRCIWCKCKTTTNEAEVTTDIKLADREHIFPEAIGGRKTLSRGKVCKSCNNGFNKLDEDLRKHSTMMSLSWQNASRAKGKPVGKNRGAKDTERKRAMMDNIAAYDGRTEIGQSSDDDARRIRIRNAPGGAGPEPYDERFSRAIHKCAVNLLYHHYSYDDLRPQFDELIEFVSTGKTDYRK